MTRVRVFPDLDLLSVATAEGLAAQIEQVLSQHPRCSFVLTGGRTPPKMYEVLAGRFGKRLPWSRIDLFWGDERYVPSDHPQSNYRMARESLLDRITIPPENVHPMPTHYPEPNSAAEEYERVIRDYFTGRPPRFDVLLLGMAGNGHVASLFPHQPTLAEQTRWVIAAEVPADPPQRITMTFPIINQAARVDFLVAGSAKAEAVRRALQPGEQLGEVPAAGVAPGAGDIIWWLDAQAAALLSPIDVESPSS